MEGSPRLHELDVAWESGLREWASEETPLAVLFSGGVDSGLLAWELRGRPSVTLVTVGTPGSRDLATAEIAAREVGLPWIGSTVAADEVEAAARDLAPELVGLSPTLQSVQVAIALALARAPVERVVCGQGVDELFLGYAHFRGLDGPDLEQRARSDLEQLLEREWPRTVRIAHRSDRSLSAPYLATPFRETVERVPLAERSAGPEPKSLFRGWARHRGLPETIAARPKRALQYGSGVDRVLGRVARAARAASALR
jgi:asparagine synthase (glutamine-hydrolysing)